MAGTVPAAAQAKGSADASAAKQVNPHWKAPRTAWGHPDLEGIWTTDDMRGVPMSMTERFTRIDPEMIDYEIHVDDPDTFVTPWTMRMTITTQVDYQIYEYGCHEGNNAMRNALSAERAYDKAIEEAKAKGLPPPERVFERVNGADRAR
jgi:hypothetical protein